MYRVALTTLTLAAALVMAGCSSTDRSLALAKQEVSSIPAGEAAAVSAPLLAEVMVRAGFKKDEVVEYGPKVRNALATSGGAQIRKGRITEALFAVHSDRLYVTSRARGTFVRPIIDPDEATSEAERTR